MQGFDAIWDQNPALKRPAAFQAAAGKSLSFVPERSVSRGRVEGAAARMAAGRAGNMQATFVDCLDFIMFLVVCI